MPSSAEEEAPARMTIEADQVRYRKPQLLIKSHSQAFQPRKQS